jgi:hypothetical protein
MKNITYVAFAALLTLTPAVNANLVTVGNIQTIDTTNFMTDTTTGRLYNRLDATLDRTFSQLTSDTMAGGSWDGWSLATSIESDDLIRALLGGTSECQGAVDGGTLCGTIQLWVDGLLGLSGNDRSDTWMFQSTYDTPGRGESDIGDVSLLGIDCLRCGGIGTYVGEIYEYDDWEDLEYADEQTDGAGDRYGYLLYKDATVIHASAPTSLSILALGLIGFAACRFMKLS